MYAGFGGKVEAERERPPNRIYSPSVQSNSKKWNNENTQKLLEEYENMYNLAFMLATNDVEKELSGIWQVRDVVGYNADTARYQWNPLNQSYYAIYLTTQKCYTISNYSIWHALLL